MSTMVLALLLGLAACGPLQVGVEPAPASAEASPAATPSATPEHQSAPGNSTPISAGPDAAAGTVVALQTANARLAGQVATLTAAQALLVVPTEAIQATATPSSLPTLAPSATPAPALPPTRITFQSGSASATVSPDLAGGSRAYVLKVLAGQHLILSADRDLDVRVTGPDGRTLTPIALRPQQWEYTIGQTGDQTMTLTGATRATVTIYVPPR